jgi:plastocyanin
MKKLIGSKSSFLLVIGFLFAILSISTSCTKSSISNMYGTGTGTGTKGAAGPNEVFIQGMAFSPSSITITAGTTLMWTNKDGVAHTVTSDVGLFDSGTINSGGAFSYLFTTAGTYLYHCAVHPTMTAKVIVN